MSSHDKKEESLVYSNENQAKGLIISVASRGKSEGTSTKEHCWQESHRGGGWSIKMLARPKPGESEGDLLRFQSQFLAAGATPAVQLVQKGSRSRGDAPSRDLVMLDGE